MTSIRRHTRSFGQATMEWTPLVRIYESRLWRRSRFFAAATGISFEEEVERIQEAAELQKARDVLDLACGTGIYSRHLARGFGAARVAGLDLSAPMLRYARGRAVAERVENLCLARGDALQLPFAEASFDAVVCCGALHLFPDADRALTEVHRVLRPGGRVALAVFQRKRGIVGDLRAEVARRIGVHFFTPLELRTRLEGAGMVTPRELHASGVWLLMSARRPEAPAGGG